MRAAQQPPVPADEAPAEAASEPVAVDLPETAKTEAPAADTEAASNPRRRGGRRVRGGKERVPEAEAVAPVPASEPAPVAVEITVAPPAGEPVAATEGKPRRGARRPRKESVAVVQAPDDAITAASVAAEEKPAKAKRPARARKPKKDAASED